MRRVAWLFLLLACRKEPISSGDPFVDYAAAVRAGRPNPIGATSRGHRLHRTGDRDDARFLTTEKWARVPIARSHETTRYAEVDGVRLVELPLENSTASIVIVQGTVDGLDRAHFDRWIGSLQLASVALSLPEVESQATGGVIAFETAAAPPPSATIMTGLGTGPQPREETFFVDRPFYFFVREGQDVRVVGRIDHPNE